MRIHNAIRRTLNALMTATLYVVAFVLLVLLHPFFATWAIAKGIYRRVRVPESPQDLRHGGDVDGPPDVRRDTAGHEDRVDRELFDGHVPLIPFELDRQDATVSRTAEE